ncbi:hypothetical protein [Streptomyces cupreus]|uniref:hypothetical protein n=1 Tax=Streptomyces cupreus TaxID=2759956 RepID=UPI0021B1E3B7|nr:hypothetical protein [Streptomyces cupreus]
MTSGGKALLAQLPPPVGAVAVAAPSARCPRGRLTELAQPLLAVARDIGRGL